MNGIYKLVLLAFLGLTACSAEESLNLCPSNATILVEPFTENFEDAVTNLPLKKIDHMSGAAAVWNIDADLVNNPAAIVIANDAANARNGSQFLTVNLKADDFASAGNRAELSLRSREADPLCSVAFYGWSFRLDPGFTETGDFQTMGQWHAQPLAGQSFDAFNGANRVYLNYNAGELRLVLRLPDGSTRAIARKIIPLGQWVDVVFEVKWSLETDGYVAGWINTTPITPVYEMFTDFNAATGNNRVQGRTVFNIAGNFFKLGLYRSANPDPTGRTDAVIYYDEFKIGNTFGEVAAN